MAVETPVIPTSNADDAAFRAWVAAIHDAIVAVGLVNTADSGQIDPTTVLRPATNLYGGYKMYRFDDARQATAPVFIKVEFGTGATATYFRWRITIGMATDGAGNLSRYGSIISSSGSSSAGGKALVSGAADRLLVISGFEPGNSSSTNYLGFAAERLYDENDVETDDAFLWVGQNSHGFQVLPRIGPVSTADTAPPVLHPPGATAVVDGDTAVFPLNPFNPLPQGEVKNLIGYMNGDLAYGLDITATVRGAARTYRTLGGSATGRGGSNLRLAALVE